MLGFSNSKEDRQQELVDRIYSCMECSLHRKRGGMPVTGIGPLRADVLLVGEAPGLQEERERYPFVVTAPAGIILTEAIKVGLGFDRAHCFIMNVVCCRPKSMEPGRQNDSPTKEEAETCRVHLEEQIEIVNPKVIVALGGVASDRLTGKELKPGQYRDKLWWYQHWPVICTWHPAFAARNEGLEGSVYQQIVADMHRVGRLRGVTTKHGVDFKEACEAIF